MHELRSPLLATANLVRFLKALPADTKVGHDDVAKRLETLANLSKLMEDIASSMLDFERIDTNSITLNMAPFQPAALLEDSLAMFGDFAHARGVDIGIDPIPASVARLVAEGDRLRLQQCLNNGVSNAVKFCNVGGCVRISTALHGNTPNAPRPEDWVELLVRVTNTGEGLSQHDVNLLNSGDPFTQVGRGALQGAGGSGLGLWITRHLLKLHHSASRLRLYCLEEEGEQRRTVFEMVVRLAVAAVSATPPEDSSAASSAPARAPEGEALHPPQGGGRLVSVLHVDDDEVLRYSFRGVLDVPVDEAGDGKEALDIVRRRRVEGKPPYDLILLDNQVCVCVEAPRPTDQGRAGNFAPLLLLLQMPGLTGAETAAALREEGFAGLLVGMTGDPAGSSDRSLFEAAGLDACVDKTLDGLQFVRTKIAALRSADAPV